MKIISDYEKINSINPLHLIVGEVDGYIEESNGNRYLTFPSTDKNKEVLTKHTKLWDRVKHLIKTINNGKEGEYKKGFRNIKVNSDGNLTLNKIPKFHMLTVFVRSVFEDDGKYYPQVFLDEFLYEL